MDHRLLELFHRTVESVPAYRRFLASEGIDPASIRTRADFKNLPHTTRESYVQRYPLPERCRDGRLESCDMVAASSGSTGKPTYWPRDRQDEVGIAWRFEQVFADSFRVAERATLAVVCFALGTWVGGMFTASCCRILAQKGYPVTTVTPGANREEIFRAVEELGRHFDQVVLLGYPPFLKDVVDEGALRGVEWPRYRVKLVLAGEVFSESWRELMASRLGADDLLGFAASIYGTADAGVLAVESRLSVAIRRWLASRPERSRQLFGEGRMPTLAQYHPASRAFEAVDRQLLFSGDNGAPLIRYNILDTGGVIEFDEMRSRLAEWGCELDVAAPDLTPVRELPFVYVFGRSDFTVSFYGANIYPENISVALEVAPVRDLVTGKFVLQALEEETGDRALCIAVELAQEQRASDTARDAIAESVRQTLLRLNSEFGAYVPPHRQTPHITLAQKNDPHWFPPGVKHRWTR